MLFVMNGYKQYEKRSAASEVKDPRRTLVLMLAIALALGSGLAWWWDEQGTSTFAAAAMGRIGLVMAALWIAWPSLRRPAQWLPPGIAVLGVVVLGVLAANPRLAIVVVPALSGLLAFSAVVRAFRGNRNQR